MRTALACLLLAFPLLLRGDDLRFREKFADPATRDEALAELIPGTRDWFFHHALHQQLKGDVAAFEATMEEWRAASIRELRPVSPEGQAMLATRELLLRYEASPEKNLGELIERLELEFNDARPDAREVEKLADTLDPAVVSPPAFEEATVRLFRDAPWRGYDESRLLAELERVEALPEAELRDLLQRLRRADHPGVVELVRRGLALEKPIRFGRVSLHSRLTLAQMDELRAVAPGVLASERFALTYLEKLREHGDAEFRRDPALHAAHLKRCRDFAIGLPPALVSLKTHVLYHHLRLQREVGEYPREDFLAYLAIPRREHPILRTPERQPGTVFPKPGGKYRSATGCPTAGDDSGLIELLLRHFLADAADAGNFAAFVEEEALVRLHARARLLAGADPARWGSRLDPAEFAALMEETRVGFAPGRPVLLDADDAVRLTLDLKNTPELEVRIHELDLPAVLSRTGREPTVDLDLDGLVPHRIRRLEFPQAPLVLHRETIELPELEGPGAWIVEFVAEGHACRALVRKGRLIPYVERDVDGQVVRVFDEKSAPVAGASLSFGPARPPLEAGEDGRILVPNREGASPSEGILSRGPLATIVELGERSDELELEARVHLDREQLLADSRATARLQLRLSNHGHELPLERLHDASLTLSAKLVSGVTTEHVIREDLELAPVITVPFQVPADTVALTLRLSGTIIPRDDADPVSLTSEASFEINRLLEGGFVHGAFTRTPAGHCFELRGRNGEPLANRAVDFEFLRDGYQGKVAVRQRLRTNDRGRVALGPLEGIRRVGAVHDGNELAELGRGDLGAELVLPRRLRVAVGEEIRLPSDGPVDRAQLSLVALDVEGRPRVDHADKVVAEPGLLVIRGLPAGRHRLSTPLRSMELEVEEGAQSGGLFVSPGRIAPRVARPMPHASEVAAEAGELRVRVDGAGGSTRVHLVGSRFVHPWNAWRALAPFADPERASLKPGFVGCRYLTDRRLDDEMRYILERREARTYPGTMLPRAGLLVQRWSREDVEGSEMEHDAGAGGRNLGDIGLNASHGGDADPFAAGGLGGRSAGPDCLDYLARSSELAYDLKPGADGVVRVPLGRFDGCQVVQVVVADRGSLHRRAFALPDHPPALRDRRLANPLDPEKHHLGTRRALALAAGAEAGIENVLDADWRAFTTLAEAHEFLYGATRSERLRDLALLLDWPELGEDEKLVHWSEHASHELNLFLARKDPEFFRKHVRPLLAEKREPGFIDDLLLDRDLSGYLRPFAWSRLNAAEKALLSQALPGARDRIAAELGDRWELESPSPEEETRRFTRTLRGTDLATRDSLGFARARATSAPGMAGAGATYILQKLRSVVIPVIDFEDLSLEEAIDYLRVRSIELDPELDPDLKGVNFVVRKPAGGGGGLLDGGGVGDARIERLFLRNVPLSEALNYICEATRLRWSVDEHAVTIKPATETDEDLFARSFQVPPDFAERIRDASGTRGRISMKEALEANGVKFPPDASAQFFADSSTLLVKNTPTNLDLVEQITMSLAAAEPAGVSPGDGLLPPVDAPMADDPFAAPEPPELPNSVGGGFAFRQLRARPSWSAERPQTRLWLESQYYRHDGPTGETFIPLNAFWRDLAAWDGEGRFLSPHFNACTTNANEALLCLAMLDLPFEADRPEVNLDGSSLRVKAREPMLLFYKDTRETGKRAPDAPVLVRQTIHRLDDRFRTEDGRKVENTIPGGLRTGVAYGSSLVVTNPTGAGRRIEVLAQIPAGAIPLRGKPATLSETRELAPYAVLIFELAFYFPAAGDFPLYPMQVAEGDTILAAAPPRTLRVEAGRPEEDRATWIALARDGTHDEVLARLREANLHEIDLDRMRWRLRDRGFFLGATAILRERLVHSQSVASYGFHHAEIPAMRSWLENSPTVGRCGAWLDSPLLTVRPVEHLGWRTLEFDPLVNPRAHGYGDNPRLNHPRALAHYRDFLGQLMWKPQLSDDDRLAWVGHLLLQDRVAEAIDRFPTIDPTRLGGRLAYDYVQALIHFHEARPKDARAIAERHAGLPPGPWRERYEAVIRHADEIAAASGPRAPENEGDEERAVPLELAQLPDGRLQLSGSAAAVALKLYQVDLEMLFSKNPFLEDAGELPGTRPNLAREVVLEDGSAVVELPPDFRRGNVLVAAEGGTSKRLEILNSQEIELVPMRPGHQVAVTDAASGSPLPGCYVKVYVERDGEAVFHKDGYTDLRGRFDYLTLTGGESEPEGALAIFVSHPDKGARTLALER